MLRVHSDFLYDMQGWYWPPIVSGCIPQLDFTQLAEHVPADMQQAVRIAVSCYLSDPAACGEQAQAYGDYLSANAAALLAGYVQDGLRLPAQRLADGGWLTRDEVDAALAKM